MQAGIKGQDAIIDDASGVLRAEGFEGGPQCKAERPTAVDIVSEIVLGQELVLVERGKTLSVAACPEVTSCAAQGVPRLEF